MPNWCINKLDVVGAEEALEKFKVDSSNSDGEFCFSALVAPPEEALDSDSPIGGWRAWADTNWGTKWDISADECAFTLHYEDSEPTMVWEFSTAWAPPTAWLAQVAPQYPELTFKLWFDEPGMSFSGCDVYQNGTITEESWESNVCFYLAECHAPNCDGEVFQDAFMRHGKNRDENEHYYCDDHELFKVIEAASAQ